MAEAGLVPDYVLCSTARRARETLEAAAAAWDDAGLRVAEQDALYPTDPETCIELLRALPAEAGRVLVVGHNPGLEELLTELTGRAETLPTAALAEVALSLEHWSDLSAETPGRLVRLWRPKDAPAVT
jgi:phosphohistidine phosphatase